jgi:hypothetical protein
VTTQQSKTNPHQEPDQEAYGHDEGHAQPPPTPDEHARRIAEVSPEGIPADPQTGRRTIGTIFSVAVAIVLVISVLLAIFVHVWVGIITALIAVLLMLVNPVLWAFFSRMKEREA